MVPNGVSVVTTWDERENLAKLISTIRIVLGQVQQEIIVVDGGSPD